MLLPRRGSELILGERVRRAGMVGGLDERRSMRAPSVETGLLSLSALETRLVAEPGPCGVIFVDLDGMKDVNDRHGHEVGDRLLRGAARRLAQVVPAGFAAPIGSDEFALLVPGLDEAVGLDWVVTRVGETLAVPFDIGLVQPVEVSATAAGALWRPGDDPRSVFRTVDERVMVGKVYRREDGFGKLADLVAGVLDRAPDVELLDAAAGAMLHLAGADVGLVLVAGEVAFAPDLSAAAAVEIASRAATRGLRHEDGSSTRGTRSGRWWPRRSVRRMPSRERSPCSGAVDASGGASAFSWPRRDVCSGPASWPGARSRTRSARSPSSRSRPCVTRRPGFRTGARSSVAWRRSRTTCRSPCSWSTSTGSASSTTCSAIRWATS